MNVRPVRSAFYALLLAVLAAPAGSAEDIIPSLGGGGAIRSTPDAAPRQLPGCPIQKCRLVGETATGRRGLSVYRGSENADAVVLELREGGFDEGTWARLLDAKGELLLGPAQIGWEIHRFAGVPWRADFNGDGRDDYVVSVQRDAVTWAAQHHALAFFLSSDTAPGGYVMRVTESVRVGAPLFVEVWGNGRCQLLHGTLVYRGVPGTYEPGRSFHDFVVYHLVEIEGTELRVVAEQPPGFPHWEPWVTFWEGYDPDVEGYAEPVLTEAVKRDAWTEEVANITWEPDRAMYLAALERAE